MAPLFDSQDLADQLALLAEPRLRQLLRLGSARHLYDPHPGLPGSKYFAEEGEVLLGGFARAVEPYQNIERFLSREKAMSFLVEPGLLPIAKAIAVEARGRRLLVTRKPAPRPTDQGATAHLSSFGVRLLLHTGPETTLTWECLYGAL
jgi:hypothetical protein